MEKQGINKMNLEDSVNVVTSSGSISLKALHYIAHRNSGSKNFTQENKEAFESSPEWVQKFFEKYFNTLHYPFAEAGQKVMENKSKDEKIDPEALGLLNGELKRKFQLLQNEIPNGQGAIGEALHQAIHSIQEAESVMDPKDLPEFKNNVSKLTKIFDSAGFDSSEHLEQLPATMFSELAKNLDLLSSNAEKSCNHGYYSSSDLEKFHKKQSYGFSATLKEDGNFTHDGGRAEIYHLIMSVWKDIDDLQNRPGSITRKELAEYLQEVHGKKVSRWTQKYIGELFNEFGFKFPPRGRPRKKSTNE